MYYSGVKAMTSCSRQSGIIVWGSTECGPVSLAVSIIYFPPHHIVLTRLMGACVLDWLY
jgi:hypothetical protein